MPDTMTGILKRLLNQRFAVRSAERSYRSEGIEVTVALRWFAAWAWRKGQPSPAPSRFSIRTKW